MLPAANLLQARPEAPEMKGIVFSLLSEMIEQKLGFEGWDALIEATEPELVECGLLPGLSTTTLPKL